MVFFIGGYKLSSMVRSPWKQKGKLRHPPFPLTDWLILFGWIRAPSSQHQFESLLENSIKFRALKVLNIKGQFPSIIADRKRFEKRFGKVKLFTLKNHSKVAGIIIYPRRKISFFEKRFPKFKSSKFLEILNRKFRTTAEIATRRIATRDSRRTPCGSTTRNLISLTFIKHYYSSDMSHKFHNVINHYVITVFVQNDKLILESILS